MAFISGLLYHPFHFDAPGMLFHHLPLSNGMPPLPPCGPGDEEQYSCCHGTACLFGGCSDNHRVMELRDAVQQPPPSLPPPPPLSPGPSARKCSTRTNYIFTYLHTIGYTRHYAGMYTLCWHVHTMLCKYTCIYLGEPKFLISTPQTVPFVYSLQGTHESAAQHKKWISLLSSYLLPLLPLILSLSPFLSFPPPFSLLSLPSLPPSPFHLSSPFPPSLLLPPLLPPHQRHTTLRSWYTLPKSMQWSVKYQEQRNNDCCGTRATVRNYCFHTSSPHGQLIQR